MLLAGGGGGAGSCAHLSIFSPRSMNLRAPPPPQHRAFAAFCQTSQGGHAHRWCGDASRPPQHAAAPRPEPDSARLARHKPSQSHAI